MKTPDSSDPAYTERLLGADSGWKRLLRVQAPYRRNLLKVVEGRVLDIGCGIGRNLAFLENGVGVDTNHASVAVAQSRGLVAYTADHFPSTVNAVDSSFDTLLFAHVLEHMDSQSAVQLVGRYLRYLKDGGRVVIVVPQEAGFRSDPTHVEPVSEEDLASLAVHHDLEVERVFSFPFPRPVGRIFRHNETVGVLRSRSRPAP